MILGNIPEEGAGFESRQQRRATKVQQRYRDFTHAAESMSCLMRVFAIRFSERAICTVASARLKPASCFAICKGRKNVVD